MTISHQIRVAASLNASALLAGLSGGKEPPMYNPPARKVLPPSNPEKRIGKDDEVRLRGVHNFTYPVVEVGRGNIKIGGGRGGMIPTWVALSQVELVRKAKKNQH